MKGHRVESIIIFLSPMLENFGGKDLKDKSLHRLLRLVLKIIYNVTLEAHEQKVKEQFQSRGSQWMDFPNASLQPLPEAPPRERFESYSDR